MLQAVAPLSADHFAGAVIMPNLVPPVDSLDHLRAYRREIIAATGSAPFEPYMTLFFRPYSRELLEAAKPHIIGIKLYPEGVTTNSEDGVKSFAEAESTLALMEELGIRLLVHGETHGFVMDRENEFLPVYERIAKRFPKLHVVMEHITTAAALALLDRYENLSATITTHHLLITLDDLAGGKLQPHLFCKPIAKRPEDRAALVQAAVTAHPRVCLGTDSAPHPVSAKEAPGCAAGCFTAPITLPLLASLFEEHNALHNLGSFVSYNAQRIYQIEPPDLRVTLEKKPFMIPERYGEVVPMWAGREISWQVLDE